MSQDRKTALIIIDVQKDFCLGGALAVSHGDDVVGPINKLIDKARKEDWLIIASRDWHPGDTKHFAQFGGKWPAHCLQNSHGAMLHPELNVDFDNAVIVSKGMHDEDAYSAFDGECFDHSLEMILELGGVKKLYIGGLATDYCVKATAIDAVQKGFKTYLALDACRAVNINPSDGGDAVEEMKAAGVIVTSTQEILAGED